MQMNDQHQIGRLAMRQEGGYWNAYYAPPTGMEQAVLLGSIRAASIVGNKKRKTEFMDMMRDVVSDLIEEAIGIRPAWGGEKPAPEHERSGNA